MLDICPIKTEAEHEAALVEFDKLFDDLPQPGTPDGKRLEQLVRLISQYEELHFPIPVPGSDGDGPPHPLRSAGLA